MKMLWHPHTRRISGRAAAAASALFLGIAFPAAAQAPTLALLDNLDKGAWLLRDLDDGSTRRICVQNGRELIQLEHAQPGCGRAVVQDGEREVTVQYTCTGDGYGRTSIRRENHDLVQISTQGIQGGLPFSVDYEARRIGEC